MPTGSTGELCKGKTQTRTPAEQSGIGRQRVPNTGRSMTRHKLFKKIYFFDTCVHVMCVCVCLQDRLSVDCHICAFVYCKLTQTGDFRTTYAKVLIPVASTIYYRYVFCCPGYKDVDTTDDGSTPGSSAMCVRKQYCYMCVCICIVRVFVTRCVYCICICR